MFVPYYVAPKFDKIFPNSMLTLLTALCLVGLMGRLFNPKHMKNVVMSFSLILSITHQGVRRESIRVTKGLTSTAIIISFHSTRNWCCLKRVTLSSNQSGGLPFP